MGSSVNIEVDHKAGRYAALFLITEAMRDDTPAMNSIGQALASRAEDDGYSVDPAEVTVTFPESYLPDHTPPGYIWVRLDAPIHRS